MINSKFSEKRIHTERSRLIRNQRNNTFSEFLGFHQSAHQANECHRCRNLRCSFCPIIKFSINCVFGQREIHFRNTSLRHWTFHCSSSLLRICNNIRNIVWMDEWKLFQILICKIKTHRISNQTQVVLVGLLSLVRCITARKSRTKSVPLDGAGKNNRWLPFVGARCCVGSMNLEEIMTAEIFSQRFKFFIGIVSDHGR